MGNELFGDLIVNASLLLSSSIVFNVFFVKREKKSLLYRIIAGIIMGIIGILLMSNAVKVSSGIIFDTRSILVSISGMFFGFVPTTIAVVIISVFRAFLGGSGVFTGILVTVLTAAAGLVWRRYRYKNILARKRKNYFEFYLMGLATHIIMLACMLTLPGDSAFAILKEISLPVLLIYPVSSLLISTVIYFKFRSLQTGLDLEQSESRFRTLFEEAPIGIALASNKEVYYINEMFEKILGRSLEEIKKIGWERITHPEDVEKDALQYAGLKAGRINSYSLIKRYIKPDESIVWVNMIITALKIGSAEQHKTSATKA